MDLLGASTQTLVMTGRRVPGIEADSAHIEGNLDLRRSIVESLVSSPFNNISTALSLSDAKVAGGMLLNGAHPARPEDRPWPPVAWSWEEVSTATAWQNSATNGWAYALLASGWVLTTTIVAGVSRTLQKN
ncbi:hypothetical protein ACFVFH_15580 [Streptomyces sp. NPDC057697]|uniref:hypothetical protein n=1 Tax=Streptomyces sp. NPDC057697 TaxID=3346219 RepID=UPI0036D18F40